VFRLLCVHPKAVDVVVELAFRELPEGLVRMVDEVGEGAVVRVVAAV
jgi:hypothetical protein